MRPCLASSSRSPVERIILDQTEDSVSVSSDSSESTDESYSSASSLSSASSTGSDRIVEEPSITEASRLIHPSNDLGEVSLKPPAPLSVDEQVSDLMKLYRANKLVQATHILKNMSADDLVVWRKAICVPTILQNWQKSEALIPDGTLRLKYPMGPYPASYCAYPRDKQAI